MNKTQAINKILEQTEQVGETGREAVEFSFEAAVQNTLINGWLLLGLGGIMLFLSTLCFYYAFKSYKSAGINNDEYTILVVIGFSLLCFVWIPIHAGLLDVFATEWEAIKLIINSVNPPTP